MQIDALDAPRANSAGTRCRAVRLDFIRVPPYSPPPAVGVPTPILALAQLWETAPIFFSFGLSFTYIPYQPNDPPQYGFWRASAKRYQRMINAHPTPSSR